MALLEAAFRWLHVVAGIVWVGHLFFFNFVNAHAAKTYDADARRKVVPELMPRALYWFRWGAIYTWVSGLLLAGMVYYSVDNLVDRGVDGRPVMPHMGAVGIALLLVAVVFFVYDGIFRAAATRNERVAVGLLYAVFVALLFAMSRFLTGRALYVHAGMLFGTTMAMNVWMRIWPAQKKLIQAAKGVGPAPDPSVAAAAALRSKHNTYMAVPLVFTMVSNHYPTIYGWDEAWLALAIVVALGFAVTKLLFLKSAGAAPALYGAPEPAPPGSRPGIAAPKV